MCGVNWRSRSRTSSRPCRQTPSRVPASAATPWGHVRRVRLPRHPVVDRRWRRPTRFEAERYHWRALRRRIHQYCRWQLLLLLLLLLRLLMLRWRRALRLELLRVQLLQELLEAQLIRCARAARGLPPRCASDRGRCPWLLRAKPAAFSSRHIIFWVLRAEDECTNIYTGFAQPKPGAAPRMRPCTLYAHLP